MRRHGLGDQPRGAPSSDKNLRLMPSQRSIGRQQRFLIARCRPRVEGWAGREARTAAVVAQQEERRVALETREEQAELPVAPRVALWVAEPVVRSAGRKLRGETPRVIALVVACESK